MEALRVVAKCLFLGVTFSSRSAPVYQVVGRGDKGAWRPEERASDSGLTSPCLCESGSLRRFHLSREFGYQRTGIHYGIPLALVDLAEYPDGEKS